MMTLMLVPSHRHISSAAIVSAPHCSTASRPPAAVACVMSLIRLRNMARHLITNSCHRNVEQCMFGQLPYQSPAAAVGGQSQIRVVHGVEAA